MLINIKPLITERTMDMAKSNWYTFATGLGTNKNQLRELIEKTFKVNVLDIKTIVVKAKSKRSAKSRKISKASDWKKVMVLLKENQKIELFDIGA